MAATAKYSRYYTYIKPVIENKIVRSSTPYIFSLLSIIIFTVFAIRPTISTILNLQKSIENNQVVLNTLNEKAQNLTDGKQNLEKLDGQLKIRVKNALPDQTNVTSLIASIQNSTANQASVSGLQIQPVNLIDKTSSQQTLMSLGEVGFSYNAQGSFTQLLAVVQSLSKSPRLVSIESVVLSKQPDSPPTLSLTGKAFYLK